jgi:hypothetical protein
MTAPAEKDYVTVDQLHQPRLAPVNYDEWMAERARRQTERDAKREEQLRCLNPAHAAQKEHEKPVYKWTVSAEWLGIGGETDTVSRLQSEQTVNAQNENDAWAKFCDTIGMYPSRRDAKPIIKRGKQMSVEAVVAALVAGVEADATIPTVKIGPKKKSKPL